MGIFNPLSRFYLVFIPSYAIKWKNVTLYIIFAKTGAIRLLAIIRNLLGMCDTAENKGPLFVVPKQTKRGPLPLVAAY
jgi:hypothetical protein